MNALRFYGNQDIRIDRVPEPVCGDSQIKLKIAWCGICGSDLHEYLGGPLLSPKTPHPLTNGQIPVTLGHEFTGTVVEIGAKADADSTFPALKLGDRVVVEPVLYDGDCAPCLKGSRNCCEKLGFIGYSGNDGGFSEYVTVDRRVIHILPENIPLDVGALIEPLAVAWHAITHSTFTPSQTPLILGAGPIGLALLLCLKARGAHTIIISEPSTTRKAHASALGADHVLDPTTDSVPARCKELCKHLGGGPDVVFDCAGTQASLDSGMQVLKAGGLFVNVAIWDGPASIMPTVMLMREKTYTGSVVYVEGDFEAVIDAISTGKIKPEKLITAKIALVDVEKEGFKALIDEKDRHVKILVHP